MSKSSKSPARKTTKPAPKQDGAKRDVATKDVAPAPATKAKPAAKPRDPRLPVPGTTTTREYKGRAIKVKYLDDGVEVDGTRYESLSSAARAVTGAKSINGFLFFGLVPTKPAAPATPRVAKGRKPAECKVGDGNDIATPAGQREALAAAGIAKRGRPISKPRDAAAAKDAAK